MMFSSRLVSLPCVCMLALATAIPISAHGESQQEHAHMKTLAASGRDFSRGLSAQRRGDLDAAATAYASAIQGDPQFVEAMTNLARVEVRRGRLDAATEWIDQAAAIEPGYPGTRAATGILALKRGDTRYAVAVLTEARAQAPRNIEILINLGVALLAAGFDHEAIESFRDAQRLDGHHPAPSLNLGLAQDQRGEFATAAHHYRAFLDRAPGHDPDRAAVMQRLAILTSQARTDSTSPPSPSTHSGAHASAEGELRK